MNEEIEQAMASLKHFVECRCDEAYTGRGRHETHSACDYADEVKVIADHIGELRTLLPDDLYDSKDWRHADLKDRVKWLITMLANKNQEIDLWASMCAAASDGIEDLNAKLDQAKAALQALKDFDDLPLSAKRPDIFEIRVRRPILNTLDEIKGETK